MRYFVSMSIPIIDADAHLTEIPTLWTDRLPSKWHDLVPRVEYHEPSGSERWRIGDRWCAGVGTFSRAGHAEFPPSYPLTWDEVGLENYDLGARVGWMDRNGITAQVLYPNLVAFEGHAIMALDDRKLALAIVQAQNDYLADFAAGAPGRFILVANLPFWSLEDSINEMRRCAGLGFTGIIWAATLDRHGLPATTDPYWDPLYAEAQDLDMSVSFHVGVGLTEGELGTGEPVSVEDYDVPEAAYVTTLGFMGNSRTISKLILHGLCHRFPRLNFVSVESGFGYVPFLIETLDWQWKNHGGHRYADRLLPSEYFRRQIYSTYWFEQTTLPLLEVLPDNTMFETDMPHPTSLTPGAGSASPPAHELVSASIDRFGEDLMRKVLFENAAKLYHYDHALLPA